MCKFFKKDRYLNMSLSFIQFFSLDENKNYIFFIVKKKLLLHNMKNMVLISADPQCLTLLRDIYFTPYPTVFT